MSRRAASSTVRVIGPAVSWLAAIGMMPCCETSPIVGLIPTRFCSPAGQRIEPSVSVPTASVARLAAAAVAEPGRRSARIEIEHVRVAGEAAPGAPAVERREAAEVRPLRQVRLAEHDRHRRRGAGRRSARPVAPCCRRAPGIRPSSAIRSSVAMLSLTITGMPCSGPRAWPAPPLDVAPHRDRDARRVGLDHGVQQRVQLVDPVEVPLRQLGGADPAGAASPRWRSATVASSKSVCLPLGGDAAARPAVPPVATIAPPAAPYCNNRRRVMPAGASIRPSPASYPPGAPRTPPGGS